MHRVLSLAKAYADRGDIFVFFTVFKGVFLNLGGKPLAVCIGIVTRDVEEDIFPRHNRPAVVLKTVTVDLIDTADATRDQPCKACALVDYIIGKGRERGFVVTLTYLRLDPIPLGGDLGWRAYYGR